jgi:hypothetical protein
LRAMHDLARRNRMGRTAGTRLELIMLAVVREGRRGVSGGAGA